MGWYRSGNGGECMVEGGEAENETGNLYGLPVIVRPRQRTASCTSGTSDTSGVVSYFSFLKVSRILQALDKIAWRSSIATRSCAMVSR